MRKWSVCLSLLILSLCAGAQQRILFRNYFVTDGLPSSTVWAIQQDRQGFMWFGTKNGLSRFDGYSFMNFQHGPGDSSSILSNFIHSIADIDSFHLWVGTETGISILDLRTLKFSSFKPVEGKTVFSINKTSDGKIWISTRLEGLCCYDPVTGKTQSYRADGKPGSLVSDVVRQVVEDGQGNLWIGTFGFGISVFNQKTRSFSTLNTSNSDLSSNMINTLAKGLNGVMWVGTMEGGLCRYDPVTHRFKNYKKAASSAIRDNFIRAIYQESPETVYIGTERGLSVLHLPSDKIDSYLHDASDRFSLADNAIYVIQPDRTGTVWIGTFFGGLSTFRKSDPPFALYYPGANPIGLRGGAVSCFLEDAPGKFWVGTEDGGLHYFNAQDGSIQPYPFRTGQQPLSYHNVHCLMKDHWGRIWIGIFTGGVNVYDPKTGAVKVYKTVPHDSTSLPSNSIFSFYEDRDHRIWVGTDRGVAWYDETTDQFKKVDRGPLNSTLIYDMYEDNSHNLWFVTYSAGLQILNKKTGDWRQIGEGKGMLSCAKLTCILDDHNGNLWIGTEGGGLDRYQFATHQMSTYNANGALTANVIFGMQQDDEGLIWLTTNEGIFYMNPATAKVRHFTSQDNLQSNQFNYKSFYKASDGRLLAGGIRGFNIFYPEHVNLARQDSKIAFTSFQLFNKDVLPGSENSPLQKQIDLQRSLKLAHDQSVMSFEFAALNSSAPEKIRYAYRMDGFDKEWNEVGNQRKATYTNLAPGHYTFRVKASTDDSSWDVPEATVRITINPPWWKTVWAYLTYVLLAGVLAWIAYHYITRYISHRNQARLERMKNQEEQAFYNRKIEFFTVMAHEIRTPLSLIIAPLEKMLSQKKWNAEEAEQLTIMDENANRLMDLVNQLLDFRRIESDAYVIRREKVEVVSLVQSIYSRFRAIPYQKDLEFTLSSRLASLEMLADPEVLDKILSNLLINAFKFARSSVRLTLMTNAEGHLEISVEDDGIGIPVSDLQNIFKKFFTVSSGPHQYHNLGGAGIGLALASSLAEKHGGKLSVSSEQGKKTVFILELPVQLAETPAAFQVGPEGELRHAEAEASLGQVLIVEDDKGIREFLSRSLHTEGYAVISCADGMEALKQIDLQMPDLVLSDVMMPEMSGYELCKTIRSNLEYSHLPVILLTARGNAESELEGLQAGADAYITKPFKWQHLLTITRNLMESRAQLRQKYSSLPNSEVSLLTPHTKDKEYMEQVVNVIRERMADPQFSVEELSREVAMSRSTLHKKLKSLTGIGPNELIRLVRLKESARLLVTNEYTMAEVAYMTGFGSPSYFSKCFLQQFNVTPKTYALKQGKNDTHSIDDYFKD